MYLLTFYVPVTAVEEVKNALFAAGAGKLGQYSHCAWQVLGEGQYLPLHGSNPTIGSVGSVEKVEEYKVEMICPAIHIKKVISTLKSVHPYETPAFQVIPLETELINI